MRLNAGLLKLIELIRTSFWFIPLIMVVSSIVMAVVLAWLDAYAEAIIPNWLNFVYQTEASTIRSLLNTVAGSMITVTSIAFSITIVTLTLASTQFGPRLVRTFMMDRGTQVVLGTFISNFTYCIALVYVMSLEYYQESTLGLAILWCLAATFVSVCVLIYFIHHVAKAIQADTVINDVYCELVKSLNKLISTSTSTSNSTVKHDTSALEEDATLQLGKNEIEIHANRSGYIQFVDVNAMFETAKRLSLHIEVPFGPGDFIVENTTILKVNSHGELVLGTVDDGIVDKLRANLIVGSKRTPLQDPKFAIHQLVEVALRALSTGVNDPYTALTCVDKLSASLCSLCKKQLPDGRLIDDKGILRVVFKTPSFTGLGEAAFDQIRQSSIETAAVIIRLLDALYRIAEHTKTEEQRSFVLSQTKIIKESINHDDFAHSDLQAIKQRINLILA